MAGDALPGGMLLDPRIGEAGTMDVGLAFGYASFAVDSGGDRRVAEDTDGDAFIVKMVRLEIGFRDRAQVFGLVHQSAVVIDVGE